MADADDSIGVLRREGGKGVNVKKENCVDEKEKGGSNAKSRGRGRKKNGGKRSNHTGNGGDDNGKGDDINGEGSPPSLTEGALKSHNSVKVKNEMERRQYNCPNCPNEGRGKFVFFKRVPSKKPIVKCPKCKKVKGGACERLYPIPKGEEKGYGHFLCGECKGTWGSSRAVGNIGQQCHGCVLSGNDGQYVTPFRIEMYRSGRGGLGIAGGGRRPAGRRMRRKPKETISEDDEAPANVAYSASDGRRFRNGGGNALVSGSEGGAEKLFDWVDIKEELPTPEKASSSSSSIFPQMKHKCTGCASGICRRRDLPISGTHDVHDGDTASTSGSIFTNSQIDKSEFPDRDIDFNDWEEDNAAEMWVTFGANGKILQG